MPIAADIYYHAYENGSPTSPPVILLHGAGGSHLNWPAEIRRLPHQHIYALDLPGHGKSGGRGQQSISAYVHLVIEWMEALAIPRAYFVGHSMGSAISLLLALHYPRQVRGLGLLGTASRFNIQPEILGYCANPTTHHKAVDALVSTAFSPQADPRLVELAGKRMHENRLSVLKGDLLACDSFDISDQLENIPQTTLLICGAEDQMTPLRQSQMLARTLPAARLEVVAGAGHMVMLEKPQETADLLSAFLADTAQHAGLEG
jgi:pimeloyl-ACP methyl ester carboxylesterase